MKQAMNWDEGSYKLSRAHTMGCAENRKLVRIRFKDQTVQKFDIHSDRNCVQSAIQIKSDKNNLVAFSVQIKNVLKCYQNIEFIM